MGIVVNEGVVIQAYNNNIVCVKISGKEKMLFSRGIGFGKKFGDKIPKGTQVEKVFVMENEDNLKHFKQVIEKVDEEFFGLCENIITEISSDLNEDLDEKIHIGLIDHLNFAIKRIVNGEIIENPFITETKVLYKKEYMLAEKAAKMLENELDLLIPEDEIGLIALHIHSSRNSGNLNDTIKSTNLSNMVITCVEEQLDIKIDKDTLNYARFVTHIKFAIKRILADSEIGNDFICEIKSKYKVSYKIAESSAKILEKYLDKEVSESEIAYLAMHIERFRKESKNTKFNIKFFNKKS